jgi:hypothetical protein
MRFLTLSAGLALGAALLTKCGAVGSFYGGTASHGWAWAVGERLNGRYQDRALIERR